MYVWILKSRFKTSIVKSKGKKAMKDVFCAIKKRFLNEKKERKKRNEWCAAFGTRGSVVEFEANQINLLRFCRKAIRQTISVECYTVSESVLLSQHEAIDGRKSISLLTQLSRDAIPNERNKISGEPNSTESESECSRIWDTGSGHKTETSYSYIISAGGDKKVEDHYKVVKSITGNFPNKDFNFVIDGRPFFSVFSTLDGCTFKCWEL